jgi:hypothetical protein
MKRLALLIILGLSWFVPACGSTDKLLEPEYGPETSLGRIRYDMWGRPRLCVDPEMLDAGVTSENTIRNLEAP